MRHRAHSHLRQHVEQRGDERCDILKTIRVRAKDDHRDADTRHVLLILQLAVRRHEHIEPRRRGAPQQVAVLGG